MCSSKNSILFIGDRASRFIPTSTVLAVPIIISRLNKQRRSQIPPIFPEISRDGKRRSKFQGWSKFFGTLNAWQRYRFTDRGNDFRESIPRSGRARWKGWKMISVGISWHGKSDFRGNIRRASFAPKINTFKDGCELLWWRKACRRESLRSFKEFQASGCLVRVV